MNEPAYLHYLKDLAWKYGPNVVVAILILIIGLWINKRLTLVFARFLRIRKVDPSLQTFFTSAVDVMMKVVLMLVVAGRLGIETTSFIAVFSALAFAVGLALQGSLGNFASGVLILLFRPYKAGDIITVGDKMGVVEAIQIFNTVLITPQGKKLIIPNSKVTEGPIENMQMDAEIRADIKAKVKDTTAIDALRIAGKNAIVQCPHRLKDKELFVEISHFVDDSMEVTVGCWTLGEHYWATYYALHQCFKEEMDKNGIELAPSAN
jgi:small conductance mechanosensitive channel